MNMSSSAPMSLPPVLWNVLRESSVLVDGQLYVTQNGLRTISHWAGAWARGSVCSKKRMPLEDFLISIAPLFSTTAINAVSHLAVFSFDVLPVLLHDCHDIQISSLQWQHMRQSVLGYKSCVAPVAPAGGLDALHPPVKRRAVSSGSLSTASDKENIDPDAANANSTNSTEAEEDVASESSSVLVACDRDRDPSPDARMNALMRENAALKYLLRSKDAKIVQQRKTIRQYQTKASRATQHLARLQSTVQDQLHRKGRNFDVSRVQARKCEQKKLNHLEFGRLEPYLKTMESRTQDDEEPIGAGWLTAEGTILLALRRNMSNCAAQDLGLVILEDTSKSTVLRAECKVGAALIASSRAFFERWWQEIYDGPALAEAGSPMPCALSFLHYREDATNHRHKMMALELEASYVIAHEHQLEQVTQNDMWTIKRLADVVPLTDGTGLGTLAMSEKLLSSLGCPTWRHFLKQHEHAGPGPTLHLGHHW